MTQNKIILNEYPNVWRKKFLKNYKTINFQLQIK